MSNANTRARQVLIVLTALALLAIVGVYMRNFLVQKTYREQAKDIKDELSNYKELSDINYEMWDADLNLKQTLELRKRTEKLASGSEELQESKKHLLNALEYVARAQEESGMSVSQLNLAENHADLAVAKEYLEKANQEAANSTAKLQEFEETHKQLF